MTYFAYYSSPEPLRADFTDEFILYMEAYYRYYGRLFMNTAKHYVHRIGGGCKEGSIKLTLSEEEAIRKKAMYNQAEDLINTALMKRMIDYLPKESTIVFKDIMSLGKTPNQAWEIYEYFMNRNIYMCFMNGSAMDSNNILSLTGTLTPEVKQYIKTLIQAYYEETQKRQNMPAILADRMRKEKKELL